jgi:hypothetical protein
MTQALSRLGFAAMCLPMRPLGVLDPHFNALRDALSRDRLASIENPTRG